MSQAESTQPEQLGTTAIPSSPAHSPSPSPSPKTQDPKVVSPASSPPPPRKSKEQQDGLTTLLWALAVLAGALIGYHFYSKDYTPIKGDHEQHKVDLSTKTMDAAASVFQTFRPISRINEHICSFPFYAHDMSNQVEVHHYCSKLSKEMRQCIMYDSDDADARIIGVEYIISQKLYMTLPEEERKYWHSHAYEVTSGTMLIPSPVSNMTGPAAVIESVEKKVMQDLVQTYGKVWFFWHINKGDPLPYGPPQLIMAAVADGQIKEELVKKRDHRLGVSTAERKRQRADIVAPTIDQHANHWQHGKAWQVTMHQVDVQHKK